MKPDDPDMESSDGQTILYGHYQRFRVEPRPGEDRPLNPYARGYAISMIDLDAGRRQRLYYKSGLKRQWTTRAGFAKIFSNADAAREYIEQRLTAISSRCAVIAL